MSATLYDYYERELTFIRQLADEFAKQYPAAAGRLRLEKNRALDPHIERLIEAFALLTGRIQLKLDDDFPELTTALLGVLYPHYLAPVPSMAIVQFDVDPARAQAPGGFRIGRHSRLSTNPINDVPCKYRTGYPVTLWPIQVVGAKFTGPPFPRGISAPPNTKALLRIQLECLAGMKFADLMLDTLRFYLTGENETIAQLYEFLFNHVQQVVFLAPEGTGNPPPVVLSPRESLFPVGFNIDDGLLPYPSQSFLGYRLLSEYFAFPEKFHFLDLGGFRQVCPARFQKRLDVLLFLNRPSSKLAQDVNADTFRLGCTPVINLFEQTAEPIPLTQARYEYRIVPDVASPEGMEVYSVDDVVSVDPVAATTTEYFPFYSFRHGMTGESTKAFWYASRRPSLRTSDRGVKDRGTEVYLNLVNLDFDPTLPSDPTLVVRTTCTNRELPGILQQAGERLIFDLEAAAPLARIRCVRSPSNPLRPPLRRGTYWRLVSHLCLNHLSLANAAEGRESLQEILRLYDFSDPDVDKQTSLVTQHLIEGINAVGSRKVTGRIATPDGGGFCRGMEVTIEFDEEKYLGTGVFLFACVLERFLGLYTSINSFTQLIARTKQGKEPFKTWPPRAGEQGLI
jgi:type VI secretion system protein ImpG